jgi:diguanylate cyclase (GGDEF)-like protein/PAS domain S-box-containing protein
LGYTRRGVFEVRSSHAVGDLTVLEAAIAAMEQGITIHDGDGRIVVCNPAAARVIGLPIDEILGEGPRYVAFDARYEDGEPIGEENSGVLRALRTGETTLGRLVELRPHDGGESTWIRVNFQPLTSGIDEPPWGVIASFLETDPPHAAPCASAVAPIALELAPEAILAIDSRGLAVYGNGAARALAGDLPELAPAIDGREPLRPHLFARARFESPTRDDPADDAPLELCCAFDLPGGDTRWLAARFRPARPGDGQVAGVCSIRDVTRERAREEALAHRALHDPLTGLANRRLIDAHLEIALARAHRGEHGVGLLFLDLDGFKQVNDEFGHKAGDAVLDEFAKRLTKAVRSSDAVGRAIDPATLVSRPGGDEFMVILGDLTADPGAAIARVVERIRSSLAEPIEVGGAQIALGVSIGAAEYPLDGRDAQTLIDRANGMMRSAKRAGRGA